MLTKAGTVAIVWLLAVSSSAAMPRSRAVPSKLCDARTTSIAKLIRQARAIGGPVTKRLRRSGIRLNPQAIWLQHTPRCGVRDDDQAIQNDAPAALLVVELKIDLRPLGLSLDSDVPQRFTHARSPQSPRGPPRRA